MKTYIAKKPYYILIKDENHVIGRNIVLGRAVTTECVVEWFDDEISYNARLEVLKSNKSA